MYLRDRREIKMEKYISYTRVSTKKQGVSGLGLESQERIIDYFTQGEIVDRYTEVYSGTNLNKCVELRKAINKAKELGAKLILAKSDRFRCVDDALSVMAELGEGNLICCDIPNADRFTFILFFAIAEREALITSLRTKQALESISMKIKENGFHISKAGNKIEHLGAKKLTPEEKAERAEKTKIKNKEYYKKNYVKKLKKGLTTEQIRLSKQIMIYRGQGLTFREIVDLLNKVEPKKESGKPYHSGDVTMGIANFQDFELGEVETSELMSEYVSELPTHTIGDGLGFGFHR